MTHIIGTLEVTDTKAVEALRWFRDWYNVRSDLKPLTLLQLCSNVAVDFAEINVYRILEEKGFVFDPLSGKWVEGVDVICSSDDELSNNSFIAQNNKDFPKNSLNPSKIDYNSKGGIL